MKLVVEEVVRVDNKGCTSGTTSYKGWEPLFYGNPWPTIEWNNIFL